MKQSRFNPPDSDPRDLLCVAVFIAIAMLSACRVNAADPAWKLELQKSNTSELLLLDGLDKDLATARDATSAAQAETAKVQATADVLKLERDRDAKAAKEQKARADGAELDAAKQRAAAWKWRLLALGTWALLASAIAARVYFKTWIPFL